MSTLEHLNFGENESYPFDAELDMAFQGLMDQIVIPEDEYREQLKADTDVLAGIKSRIKPKRETGLMADSLGMYLNDIGQYPVLEPCEEPQLAHIIARGIVATEAILIEEDRNAITRRRLEKIATLGDDAKELFYLCNLKLVVSIAKKYRVPQNMDKIDIIQEGNTGLNRAIEKFDPTRGWKFSTYATHWIRQAIGRSIEYQSRAIRLPAQKHLAVMDALREAEGNASAITDPEIAHYVKLSTPTSLDKHFSSDSEHDLSDIIADSSADTEQIAIQNSQNDMIENLLSSLQPEQQYVLRLRHGIGYEAGMTFKEISELMGKKDPNWSRVVAGRAYAHIRNDAISLFYED